MNQKCLLYFTLINLFFYSEWVQSQIVYNIAGTTNGYGGDGGLATAAQLQDPRSVCVDYQGNIIIADRNNDRVRIVDYLTGVITTIAGNGISGYSGDGGLAINATLNQPNCVAIDNQGNIFIADLGNQRIRKINHSTDLISTVAGIGVYGFSGDGSIATLAQFKNPMGIFVDSVGNLFIADSGNRRIRKVNKSTGIITTIAGNGISGYSGDGGLAINAQLKNPTSVYVDAIGNVFFADRDNQRVRKVDYLTGVITTIAGNGIIGFSGDGGFAINAQLNYPTSVYGDSVGNLYIADSYNNRIRKISDSSGVINTILGNGIGSSTGNGGLAINATTSDPEGVYISKQDDIYIAEIGFGRIRKISNNLSSHNNQQGNMEISTYPNPVGNKLNINGIISNSSIKLFDIMGNLIFETETNLSVSIDCNKFKKGVYVLKIVGNSGYWIGKVIIADK